MTTQYAYATQIGLPITAEQEAYVSQTLYAHCRRMSTWDEKSASLIKQTEGDFITFKLVWTS